MTTATINDTLVHLDSLYTAYNEILEQAKVQLEALEISDSTITRMTSELLDSREFMTKITSETREVQRNMLDSIDESMEEALAEKLSQKVWNKLESSLENALNDRFNELLNSQSVADKVRSYILGQQEIKDALSVKAAMACVVEQVK